MLSNCGDGEDSWDSKKTKIVNPKGNWPWIFIGRADAEALVLWPPDTESQLIEKDPDAGKHWGQEEKGITEEEMTGWHHRLNGRVWASSGRQWRTGKAGLLWVLFTGSQGWTRFRDWTTTIWCETSVQSFFRISIGYLVTSDLRSGITNPQAIAWYRSVVC